MREPDTKGHVVCDSVDLKHSGTGELAERESSLVDARGWGGDRECPLMGPQLASLWGMGVGQRQYLCNLLNVLSASEWFVLKWLLLC